MSDNKAKKKGKPRRGRPAKHGGYSLIYRDKLIKENPHLRLYLQDCRDGLVQDVAGSEEALSEQQRIMIDRIISRLSICRLIEIYVEQRGLFKKDALIDAIGKNYLAFCGQIDRALVALGLSKKQTDKILSPEEQAILIKAEAKEARKKK